MKKVLIRGPILSQSGYGEHARFVLNSLKQFPDHFDIFIINVGWGATSWIDNDDEERIWIDSLIQKTVQYTRGGGTFDMSVQVQIPNEFEKLAPYNIGITAGSESTKISPEFLKGTYIVDKIITISEHSKFGFKNTSYEATDSSTGENFKAQCPAPVEVIGYPVKKIKKDKKFKLNLKYDFNFLTVGTFIPRKNLVNTIKWFVEQFKEEEVGLIVKTTMGKTSLIDRRFVLGKIKEILNNYEDRKCEVYLLHGDLTENEMTSLYTHPKVKCLISLSHGEGFGLPLYEAAYNGLPIVAPNWGGQHDFLNIPVKNKKGKIESKPMFSTVSYDIKMLEEQHIWDGVLPRDSMWCYPKEWDYKKTLKNVMKNHKTLLSQAKKLKKYLSDNFSVEAQQKKMAECINGESIVVFDKSKLPKISIITSIYDGDEFIEAYLEDITRQTIFESNCELILINANSPGNESEIIEKYLTKYPDNIVYKKLEKDPGIYGVWNLGIEMASGDYITNANLDDRKRPDSLEKHAIGLFTNEDVDLVYADMAITDKPNEIWEKNSSSGRQYNFPEFSFDNLKMINMPHASPMWKKSLHNVAGKFDDTFKSAGDWEMWLRAASKGKKFKKIPNVLGLYYFNPKGISTNPENFSWKQAEEKKVFEKYKDLKVEG
jgi:glycosyltransferase involved in cell wall biosynthesis